MTIYLSVSVEMLSEVSSFANLQINSPEYVLKPSENQVKETRISLDTQRGNREGDEEDVTH